MKSAALGKNTSPVEVSNISPHGFWLLLGDEELFVPFSEFPWFREANVRQISRVELPTTHHLYWPELDVDLAVASIRNPKAFPLRVVSSVSQGGIDDWDKAASFDVGAAPRRSTSSLDDYADVPAQLRVRG